MTDKIAGRKSPYHFYIKRAMRIEVTTQPVSKLYHKRAITPSTQDRWDSYAENMKKETKSRWLLSNNQIRVTINKRTNRRN